MKHLSLLLFLLLFYSSNGMCQSLNVVRNLGKVNFADSADLVLSAKVESGKYTYVLTDIKDPETPVFSFALVSNSVDVFKASIKAKLAETSKQIAVDDAKLEKYFFYFENQNPFLIEDAAGGNAMEMIFSDTLTIFNFKHKVYSQIKKQDVLKLLNSITTSTMSVEDFEKKDAFDKETYKDLEIKKENQISENPTLNNDQVGTQVDPNSSQSNSQKSKIFRNNDFIARLFEIEKGTPKPLRWEELYQEIQYRYYKYLIENIKKEVTVTKVDGDRTIQQIQKDLLTLRSKRINLINDTTKLKKENRDISFSINNSKAKKIELENQISSKLNLYKVPENGFDDNQELQRHVDTLFQANYLLASNLGGNFGIEAVTINDFQNKSQDELTTLFNSDKIKVQQKSKSIIDLNLENVKLNDLETKLNKSEASINLAIDSLSKVSEKLKSNSDTLEKRQKEVLTKIKSELNALKNSNKFHFKARELQMEFNRGYLENIIVVGEASIFIESSLQDFKNAIPFPPLTLKFVNDYPIGISAKKDIERLGDIKLYARYQDQVHYEMRIGDLITNIKEILALDRTDYSPLDGPVTVDLLTRKNIELKKSPTKEILQLKVFSDFVGLQEENPNGLIQFEVDKEIPLVTKRLTKPYLGPIRFLVNKSGNVGFFNFFRPRFIFSKIEDNNSSLELTSFQNIAGDTLRFGTSTLEIKQFERFSIGTDLNLFLYNIPYGKSTFLINAGMYFGRTDFAEIDSIPSSKSYPRAYTNTYQPSTELLWRITGDERYGIELSYGITWVISNQLNFTQRSNTFELTDFNSFKESNKDYGIQRFMILAYLNLDSNSSGRMFFRYISNSELGNFKNNFSQLQIGYSKYLTKPSK